VGIEPTTSAV